MQDFEKLGAFYLGKQYDLRNGKREDDLLLYDSKDLTTHAMCVGMTGSGKTGLCLSLLEEAAIDGIPAICLDPKGDLGNLLLSFPSLLPSDFQPWVDPGEAVRKGMTPQQYAASTATMWKEGLAEWGQDGARIQRFRDAAEVSIYTPGGSAGIPLTVLRSFDAPPAAILADDELFRERIAAAVAGLLTLMDIDADPIQSREFILLSNILDHNWRAGKGIDLAGLIHAIGQPPFGKVGFLDLETFYPQTERFKLSMRINNLLASPKFASWTQGAPLDIRSLLYTKEGRPRLSILSISHLSDKERMFFVTILLNEVLSWVRSQPGTTSLRALLYMDEVFGYFPPTANPPSKTPMLTLLKQARAYGLGVVLATQNPVDLDYKGLSNMGTWFLGRLQTERDKARVLEGLEGASAESGAGFDKQKMEETLAGLGSRVFLMHNVHEDAPVVFQTRWALSYLRGPLSREHIQTLMADKKAAAAANEPATAAAPASTINAPVAASQPAAIARPVLGPGVDESFLPRRGSVPTGGRMMYRAAVLGVGKLHFVRSTYKVDQWKTIAMLQATHDEESEVDWAGADQIDPGSMDTQDTPDDGAEFGPVPSFAGSSRAFGKWGTELKKYLYQERVMTVWKCAELKQYSEPGEPEGDFRIRLKDEAREIRDLAVEKLRKKYSSKLATVADRVERAEAKVSKETTQYRSAQFQSVISFGTSILGAVFGRKLASVTNINRAGTAMRSVSRAAEQGGDITVAKQEVEKHKAELAALEAEFKTETEELEDSYDIDNLELEPLEVRPRKSDIAVDQLNLLWTPWYISANGIAEPAYRLDVIEENA